MNYRVSDDEAGRGNAPPGFACPPSVADAQQVEDVILLHGFFGAPWTMRALGRRLRLGGLNPYCPWYESWANPFDAIVDRIARLVEARGLGRDRLVHFVGHSMGGLIARAVVDRIERRLIGRMVMIGTPNAGSELADFCTRVRILRPLLGRAGPVLVTRRTLPALDDLSAPAYAFGNIAGNRPLANALRLLPPPHDGKVSVASTHLAGEADHIILPVSHGFMPFSRSVQEQSLYFLRQGRFDHPD